MIIEPSENKNLIGLDHYFNEIINIFNNGNLPNKILLSGRKGVGKSTLSYHIINYILSIKEDNKYDIKSFTINENNRSYKLLQNQ